MSKLKVGTTSTDMSLVGHRDAFHVPGVLVTCDKALDAGQAVMFVDADAKKVRPAQTLAHGVVDPFLCCVVAPNQVFWMFVNPDLVDGFVHRFEIAGCKEAPAIAEAKRASLLTITLLEEERDNIQAKYDALKKNVEKADGDLGECYGCY